MFKTILTAVDGSEHSMHAVRVASDIAQKYSSKLILLHVLGHGPVPEVQVREAEIEYLLQSAQSAAPSVADAPVRMNLTEQELKYADRIREVRQASGAELLRHAKDIANDHGVAQIIVQVAEGNAAKQVLEQATRHHADLIVMGTRGLSDMKGLLLGSVSHKVCQFAECACLTVKSLDHD